MTESIFDHDRLNVYRLSIDYVASSFETARPLEGLHRHARDQWLRAAQSIARADTLSDPAVEYEYEYRDAEYEYGIADEPEPERCTRVGGTARTESMYKAPTAWTPPLPVRVRKQARE
jgi:hypothetical protein